MLFEITADRIEAYVRASEEDRDREDWEDILHALDYPAAVAFVNTNAWQQAGYDERPSVDEVLDNCSHTEYLIGCTARQRRVIAQWLVSHCLGSRKTYGG